MEDPDEGMRVGELARRTGVSTAAINFYVREGLLPRPRKTSRTRALYPDSFVSKIEKIKELQAQGMPLRLIKRTFESEDPAAAIGLTSTPAPERPRTPSALVTGLEAFLQETGLDDEVFGRLVGRDLLQGHQPGEAETAVFSRQDVAAGRAYAALISSGVPLRLLARHAEYEPLARAEAHLLAEHLASAARRRERGGRGSATTVAAAFGVVRDYLRLRQLDAEYTDWRTHPRPRRNRDRR